ncbi:MAG TPA: cupin domain-containing protein, partial [Vicinamibacterales bacterium]|nr:cupin domain-containing protein [Vicinamibacterales bacterium]
ASDRRRLGEGGSPDLGASMTVIHHRWDDITPEQINSTVSRQYITAERVTMARFELKRGAVVPQHAHENEQVSYIISGALKFIFEGRDIIARGGEVLQIPPNVPHAAEAIEDTLAIDVFSPVRQDWIDKTDSYFRR